jgi:DNA transposition AAA+ family ATPase
MSMPFVETFGPRDIFHTINLAREMKKNAAIVGYPGVGKPRALLAYEQQAAFDHASRRLEHLYGRKLVHLTTATAISGNTQSSSIA